MKIEKNKDLKSSISLLCKYDDAEIREDGYYDVRNGEAWGIVDTNGQIIAEIKYSKRLPTTLDYTVVEDSVTKNKGLISPIGKEIIPTVYEWLYPFEDFYCFGVGGQDFTYDDELECNFLGNRIISAQWGCINKNGDVIIDAKYSSYEISGEYILAEQIDCLDSYSKYDLYTKKGELIFCGFSLFEKTNDGFLFFFGRPYDESIGKFKSDKNKYLERYGRWLYIDNNLVTIDGFRYQFRKGFVGTVKRIVKDGKATDTYNIPLEILRKEKPKVFNGYLVNRENKKEWAIRVSDRAFSWLYDEIDFVDDNYMLIREGDKLHLTYFTSLEIRPVYSLITKPVNGKYFAVKKNEDDNCEVDFLDVDNTIFPIVAIPSCSYEDLLQYLKAGKLLITQRNNGDNKNIWKIPDPSIFDKDFLEQFPLKKDEMASYGDDKVYWYPKM